MRREDNPQRPQRDVTQPRAQPNQGWICGYSEIGQCCRSGPTCDGRCSRIVASEDTNSEVAETSTADNELPPCIPRRSLAVRRQSLRLNLAILTGGLLMLCMAIPSREKVFVPGELSAKHAQILDNTLAAQRCGLCHPASHQQIETANGNELVSGLLTSARRMIENDGRQDELCMKCHRGHLPGAVNRDPHDLSPKQWRDLQRETNTPWQLVSTRSSTSTEGFDGSTTQSAADSVAMGKTSCAMCHTEHHGRSFDIQLISDSRCQSCHQRQFESLASGHPEFKNYPIDRPRGLAFSHREHTEKHFPKKNRDFDCKACHLSGTGSAAGDRIARSLSFEHACASCHAEPIRAATVDGWAMIQLPSIESADAASEAELSDWPAGARYGYDGVVSPVLRALLMADAQSASVVEQLPASGKLVDTSSIFASRAGATKTLAAATRRLIDDTARDGQAAWIARLEKVTRQRLVRDLTEQDHALIDAMVSGLPPDLFRQLQTQWFHNGPALSRRTTETQPAQQAFQSRVRAIPIAQQQQQQQQQQQLSDDLLAPDPPPSPTSSDDLLAPSGLNDKTDDALLGTTEPKSTKAVTKLVKGATHLSSGGWYADQSTLSVRYMPTGHADPTLAAWVQWWSMIASDSPATVADQIPGNCSQCHQLSNATSRLPTAHSISKITQLTATTTKPKRDLAAFRVTERDAAVREFTKFSHTAHLTLPALSDCRYCHQDKTTQPALPASLAKHHPVMSEFEAMRVSQCSACHRRGGASDRCTQCHNYHVTGPTEN